MKPRFSFPFSPSRHLLYLLVTCASLAWQVSNAQTNGTWNFDGGGNWSDTTKWTGGTVASGAVAIADFSTLDITGDPVVTLDAPYTIGTVLSQDATTAGNNWTLGGAGPLTLANGANQPVLNVINQSMAISTPMAGTNGFSKTGTGNLVLSGGGTLTGNVVVSAGSVVLGADNGISSGAGINIFGGASATRVLDLAGFDQSLSGFTFTTANSSGNLTINGGANSTLSINATASSELGPGGSITTSTKTVTVDMSGLGEFVWSGAASTLRVGLRAGASNASAAITGNTTVTLAGKNSITAAALGISTVGASSNGGNGILHLGQTNTLNVNSIGLGSSGRSNATLDFNTGLTNPTVTIRGTDGTSRVSDWEVGRVLNVSQTTTWTATADFSAGQLDARVTTLRIGRADTGTSTSRIGTENGIFSMSKGALDVTTLVIGQYAGASTGTVNTTLNGNGTFNLSDATGTVTAENIILADNIGLATGGTRTTSGTFNLTAGTLEAKTLDKGADTGNATGTTRTFNFSSGTIRNYAGFNLVIANFPINLTGSGPRTFDATAGQSITVSSSSGISGASQGFTKTGTGTLSLQGANTYTGPTDVQAGTLAIANSFPSGALTVAAAATLDLANVTISSLGIDGNLILSGPVTVTGPSGAIPGTIPNVLQYAGITGGVNLNHKYRNAGFTVGATATDLTVAAGLSLTWSGAGGPTWDYNTTVSWQDASNNPEKFFWADSVTFDTAGSAFPTVTLAGEVRPLAIVVNEATVDYSFNGTGFIGGDGTLTKSGAAKLTVNTNNTRTGATTINAGTLEIGSGGTTGSVGSGNIVNNGSLVFNRSNDITIANAISGTGSVTKLGAGALSITTDNSYLGGTTISSGTLFVGRQTTGGSLGTGDIVNNGTLRLNRADGTANPYAYTFANNISGTGELIVGQNVVGSSAFDAVATVTGNNSFAGTVTVNSGGLKILNAAGLGTGPKNIILTNGSNGRPQLYLDGSGGNITLPADFSLRTSNADGSRPAIGNLAGDNVIEGTLTVTSGGGNTLVKVIGGTLSLNGQISAGASARILQLAGTLGANGTINGKMTNGTNPWALNVVGPNTWTLTNSTNDFTGTTTVSGGTLLVNANQPLATGAVSVATGGTLGGTGTIGGVTTVDAGGILAPGNPVGTLTVATDVTIAGTLAIEINGANADRLDVTGTLDITNATIDFNEIAAASGSPIIIASYGTLSGTQFASVIDLPTGYSISYNYNSLKQVALVSSGGGDYSTWAGGFGLNPLTDGAPTFDKDKDGLTNAQEYAFGLDPVSGTSVSPITVTLSKASGTFKYTRRLKSLTGLNYIYETSTTLIGAWPTFVPVSEVSNGGSPVEEITVTLPAGLVVDDKRFVRVLAN